MAQTNCVHGASIRLMNLGLRSITVGARFLFIFFIARYLEPASVGYYGIFTVTISYALFCVGLDFYTYVSREIVKTPAEKRGRLLKGQAAVSGFLYLTLIPLAAIFLSNSNWPGSLVWWFFPVLILEHLNQEISRLMTALSEQLASSFILFVRQGSWSIVAIVIMSLNANTRTLDIIMPLWATSGIAALILGVAKLNQLKTKGWHLPVDWRWVKQGVIVSIAFLGATLALRGLNTFDRYWVEELGGIEIVAGYVLMQGVASVFMIFVESTIFAFAYPELIKFNYQIKHNEAFGLVKNIFLQTLLYSVIFSFASWLLLPYFLAWIDNPTYQNAVSLYPWILSAVIINALGMPAHLALYAYGKDKPIILSNIAALVVFGATTLYFSKTFGSLAVPIGLNAAFVGIFLWQTTAYMLMVKPGNQATSV